MRNHGADKWGTWWPYPNRNLPSCMSYCYSVIRKVSDASHWDFLLKTEGVIGAETVDLNRRRTRKTRIPNWPQFRHPKAVDPITIPFCSIYIWRITFIGLECIVPITNATTPVADILVNNNGSWCSCPDMLLFI